MNGVVEPLPTPSPLKAGNATTDDSQQLDDDCCSTSARVHKITAFVKRNYMPILGIAVVLGMPAARDLILSIPAKSAKKKKAGKGTRGFKKVGADGIVEAYPAIPAWISSSAQVGASEHKDATMFSGVEHVVDAVLDSVGFPSLSQLRSGDDDNNAALSNAGMAICYSVVLIGAAKYFAWHRKEQPRSIDEQDDEQESYHQHQQHVVAAANDHHHHHESRDDYVNTSQQQQQQEQQQQYQEVFHHQHPTSESLRPIAEPSAEGTATVNDALYSGYADTGRMSTASSEPTHGERIYEGRQTPRTSMLRTVDSAAKSNKRLYDSVQKKYGGSTDDLAGPSDVVEYNTNDDAEAFRRTDTNPPPVFGTPQPKSHHRSTHESATLQAPSQSPLTREDLRSMPPNMHPPTPPTNALRSTYSDEAMHRDGNHLESTPILSPQSPQIFVSGLVSLALALPTQTPADVAALAAAAVKYSCKEVLLVEPSVGPGSKTSSAVNETIRNSAANFKIFKSAGNDRTHSGATVMMSYIHDDEDPVCVAIHRKRCMSAASPSPSPRGLVNRSNGGGIEGHGENDEAAEENVAVAVGNNDDDDDADGVVNRAGVDDEAMAMLTPRDSVRLYDFTHPSNAIYFFDASPVDHESEADHLKFCGVHVHLSDEDDQAFTSLSAIVNITLYDRSMKLKRRNGGPYTPAQTKALRDSPYNRENLL